MSSPNDHRYARPTPLEWLALVVGVTFTAGGFFALFDKPKVAVPTIVFFGFCAAMAARTVWRKRRFARMQLLSVEIAGGVPLRPSRAYLTLLGLALSVVGTVLVVYWRDAPLVVQLCAWLIAGAGALLLLGIVTRRLPIGFLQFDPAGLTIGRRRDSYLIPWDAIAAVRPGEFHSNPVLLLWLHDPSLVVAKPPRAHARVVASLHSSANWVGAHVMVMSSQYAIDLPLLVTAVERYVTDARAREGLAVPRLSANESGAI